MKKSIKKRSLMSAVAMLVISAIVLTTSTYAWFSISDVASFQNIDITVQSQSGITLSVDGTNFYSYISNAHVQAKTGSFANIKFVPVDYNSTSFVLGTTGESNTINFTPATVNQDYLQFDLYIKVGENGTISFQKTPQASSFGGSIKNIAYMAIEDKDNSTEVVYSADGAGSYNYINSGVTTATLPASFIVEDGSLITAQNVSNSTIKDWTIDISDLAVGEEATRHFTLKIWIEGQDAQCAGNFSGGTMDLNLSAYFTAAD